MILRKNLKYVFRNELELRATYFVNQDLEDLGYLSKYRARDTA